MSFYVNYHKKPSVNLAPHLCTGINWIIGNYLPNARQIVSSPLISWISYDYLQFTRLRGHHRIIWLACCARSAHSTEKLIASPMFSPKAMTKTKPKSANPVNPWPSQDAIWERRGRLAHSTEKPVASAIFSLRGNDITGDRNCQST